ncbi:hypothetical protein [Pinibacter soli]|uniref:Uncharacterized protein n=1 Tax=Pinibacter soli TaxID=3044211 RepID=A0ABT6RCY5_9BACT|nr:hypothetical protein [Pinibacter soli]MDI3320420.1 hypothetical protein [Pinibacter soli]
MKAVLIGCTMMICCFVALAQTTSSPQEATRVAVKSLQNNVWKFEDNKKKKTSYFSIDNNQRMSLLVVNGKDSIRFPDYDVDYEQSKPDEILFKTTVDTLGSKYLCFVKVTVKDNNKLKVKQAYNIGKDTSQPSYYEGPQYGGTMEFRQINCCNNHDPHHCVNGLSEMLSFCKTKKCTF